MCNVRKHMISMHAVINSSYRFNLFHQMASYVNPNVYRPEPDYLLIKLMLNRNILGNKDTGNKSKEITLKPVCCY